MVQRSDLSDYQALRASEQQFRAIFETAFQFIGLLKLDGTLVEVNRGPLEWYQIAKSDIVGRLIWNTPYFQNTSQEVREHLRSSVAEAAGGRFVRYEIEVPDPNGEIRTFDFSLMPVKDDMGQVVAIIPEGRDITERKRMEQALREAKSQLEEALRELRTLRGLLSICAWCKKIRDDQNYWHSLETYISTHTEARFTHSICPECKVELMRDLTK